MLHCTVLQSLDSTAIGSFPVALLPSWVLLVPQTRFLQTGIGINTWGLNEIAVLNLAKVFETAQGFGNPSQALPRNPPPAGASWASIDLVFKPGQRTYPMVAFIYALYRQSYKRVSGGSVVKRWGLFTMSSSGQGLAANYFFYPLPKPYLVRGIRALKSIKV